jgi:riboflavin-specific deaminase-like protein
MTTYGQHVVDAGDDEEAAWRSLLLLAQVAPGTLKKSGVGDASRRAVKTDAPKSLGIAAPTVFELYLPLLGVGPTAAMAHLGQSLDGRIATASGASHYVTGQIDILHNHRMRALCDAVLVGAGTVRHDDPQLTVRLCDGANPVRVIVDTERRLGLDYHVFLDGCAETLLLTAEDKAGQEADDGRHGQAAVIGVPRRGQGLCPWKIRETLAARGINRLFIEGGGITVSRFLEAGALDLLQVTVAPLIIGSGRMGISLPEVTTLADGLRPPVRYFQFGGDVMVECDLRDCRR